MIKLLFRHGVACKNKNSCVPCKRMWALLRMHARNCRDPQCRVPKCRYVNLSYLVLLVKNDFSSRKVDDFFLMM